MYVFKSCPKCKGDLAVEKDGARARSLSKGIEFTCLQCGYYLPASQRRDLLVRIAAYVRERSAAGAAAAVTETAGAPMAA